MFHNFVLPNGKFDEQKIIKKEKLYQGMNGRFVERIFIVNDQSYIFKPLSSEAPFNQELWVHQHILKDFPSIYPKIVAHNYSSNPDASWMLMEDCGFINHTYKKDLLLKIVSYMALWHEYPTKMLKNKHLSGQKPTIEEIQQSLFTDKAKVINLTQKIGISNQIMNYFFLQFINKPFEYKKVLSHGDLHLGNYGYSNRDVVVIDWEHLHLNIPHWDLYYLIDSTHPEFPKVPNVKIREVVLEYYLDKMKICDQNTRKAFLKDYYIFTFTFSIWMLLLICEDLSKKELKWSEGQLKRQLMETIEIIEQCGSKLM